MNCRSCGKFCTKGTESDTQLEDEVLQWWHCKPCKKWWVEHLYFKSEFNKKGEK